uniref:Uncharacterized protein n=1 Tax=Timema shepardi TaxID=629360 RepID=A0A7R9B2T8_TIMSH|nr:unnamed protein product [Timema shepardi]
MASSSVAAHVLMKKGKRGAAAYVHADCSNSAYPQHLNELLDLLLNPGKTIDDWETIDWCKWLIAGGRTPDEFASNEQAQHPKRAGTNDTSDYAEHLDCLLVLDLFPPILPQTGQVLELSIKMDLIVAAGSFFRLCALTKNNKNRDSHLGQLKTDMKSRFEDLTKLQIPAWILDSFSFEPVDKFDNSLHTKFLDLKYDCEAKIIFKQSGYELVWVKLMDSLIHDCGGKLNHFSSRSRQHI